MRTVVAALLLLAPGLAMAQETVWALQETPSARFADADTPGPTFDADAELTVLVREGERLRVLSGGDIGWIEAASVTTVAPVKAESLPGLGTLDMGSLQQMLDMPPMPSTPSKLPPPPSE